MVTLRRGICIEELLNCQTKKGSRVLQEERNNGHESMKLRKASGQRFKVGAMWGNRKR